MTSTTYANTVASSEFSTGLMGRVKTYFARTRAQRQLHQLDDRMLADIGVHRSEIQKVVWGN
jgi:uncharacterized protein YjiS (DUF1127 family)